MTSVAYRVKTDPPLRDLEGKFTKATQAMLDKRRDVLRDEGRRLVELMREEAPRRSGEFARGIRFRTKQEGANLVLEVTTPQPLGSWIIEGTRPHVITPKRAKALRWFPQGSIGGIEPDFSLSQAIFATRVNHPGTDPNRFHGRAVRRWKPGARSALRAIAKSYSDSLQR